MYACRKDAGQCRVKVLGADHHEADACSGQRFAALGPRDPLRCSRHRVVAPSRRSENRLASNAHGAIGRAPCFFTEVRPVIRIEVTAALRWHAPLRTLVLTTL
jgi:hypothetical protein